MLGKVISILGLILSAAVVHAGEPPRRAALPEVDPLILGTDFDTPTCSIETTEGQTIFAIPFDLDPVMKLGGKVVQFHLAEGEKSLWDYSKQGEEISTKYIFEGLSLQLKGTVTRACGEDDGCEFTEMIFDVIFGDGAQSKTFEKLAGGCGA